MASVGCRNGGRGGGGKVYLEIGAKVQKDLLFDILSHKNKMFLLLISMAFSNLAHFYKHILLTSDCKRCFPSINHIKDSSSGAIRMD